MREEYVRMEKRYYIAYGSNLNVREMRARCPKARIVGTSVMEHYRLLFRGNERGAYLTVEPEEGGSVPVAVWEVTEEDETALDCYEDYPVLYYKTELTLPVAEIGSGSVRELAVFVYIMHEERPLAVPSAAYVSTCREGYRDFGFDERILERALTAVPE